MGILSIVGEIELKQFWPLGTSDADTTKIKVNVGENSFTFQKHPEAESVVTKIFDGAKVKGKGLTEVIKNGQITVRLQGTDAPELHYRPTLNSNGKYTKKQRDEFNKYNEEYRQYWGETATIKLTELLSSDNTDILPCKIETRVKHPNDVCDVYSRIVGDVIVDINGKQVNINHWLVEGGLAFPSFYNSMSDEEILMYLSLVKTARSEKKNIYSKYSPDFKDFRFDLVFRRNGQPDFKADNKKPVQLPKLFRRFATFSAMKKARIIKYSFEKYLYDSKDSCFETNDFIENGVYSAETFVLGDFLEKDIFTSKPENVVFSEKPSVLVDSNGNKITKW